MIQRSKTAANTRFKVLVYLTGGQSEEHKTCNQPTCCKKRESLTPSDQPPRLPPWTSLQECWRYGQWPGVIQNGYHSQTIPPRSASMMIDTLHKTLHAKNSVCKLNRTKSYRKETTTHSNKHLKVSILKHLKGYVIDCKLYLKWSLVRWESD